MNEFFFKAPLSVTENVEMKEKKYVFKIPRLQCPNQGSHMMEFLLLSLESVCMIVIRALTGMHLISSEEKMLR